VLAGICFSFTDTVDHDTRFSSKLAGSYSSDPGNGKTPTADGGVSATQKKARAQKARAADFRNAFRSAGPEGQLFLS